MIDHGFDDVDGTSWYVDSVARAYQNGYMPGGYDLALFRPMDVATRADLASTLFGLSGGWFDAGDGTGGSTPFSDISSDAWYSKAVQWCSEAGLMNGDGDSGVFRPDSRMTREELAVAFANYAKCCLGQNPVPEKPVDEILGAFHDSDAISPDAREAVAWIIEKGVLPSVGGAADPQGSMTRVSLAVVACRLQENPIAEIPQKIAVDPMALSRGDGNVHLVVRAFGAQSLQWEKYNEQTATWEAVPDATKAHIVVSTEEYANKNEPYRCSIDFPDTGVIESNSTDGTMRDMDDGVVVDTSYRWSIDGKGVLRISSPDGQSVVLPEDIARNAPWNDRKAEITAVVVEGDVKAPRSLSHMFGNSEGGPSNDYTHLVSADLSHLDMTGCEYVDGMFRDCPRLQTVKLGLTGADPVDTSHMFSECPSLESVDFGFGWSMADVEDTRWMFDGCSSLKSLDVSTWDMGNARHMSMMFYGCSSLESLDVSTWNTGSVEDVAAMFASCSNLRSINVSSWSTGLVKSSPQMSGFDDMFAGCSALDGLDLSAWEFPSNTAMRRMFDGCAALEYVKFPSGDSLSFSSVDQAFSGCQSLVSLDVANWDVSGVTNYSGFSGVFAGCSSLVNLDVSKWDVSGTDNFSGMFSGCSSLVELDLSQWDTAKAERMGYMFRGCSSLEKLDVSGWDMSHSVEAPFMFGGCSSLSELDLSGWKTSGLKQIDCMFAGCSSLEKLDLSQWDTSATKLITGIPFPRMFEDCYKLFDLTLGENFKFVGSASSLRAVPAGMCWKAASTGDEIATTAELVDYHNQHARLETYTLAASSGGSGQGGGTGGGSGGGGGSTGPSLDIQDETGGKVVVGPIGDASDGISRIRMTPLAEDELSYKLLAGRVEAGQQIAGAYRIEVTGEGKIAASFEVGPELNGETVEMAYVDSDGSVVEVSAIVVGGSAVVLLDGTSDVMVFVPAGASDLTHGFPDVSADDWYVKEGYLDYVVENGLMQGHGNGDRFGPGETISRGQIVTVLWRMAGSPVVSAADFDDVDYGMYYGDAIAWARATGVVGGYGSSNMFGPEDTATRGQMAVMLTNYAKSIAGLDVTVDGAALADKADVDSIPAWAHDALAWTAENGIITGRVVDGESYMAPDGTALRCEAAKMFTAFHRDVLQNA
ncbi:MAG: BspA family leucine-rich repeat surface protein [Slackia sp.]|nr:BspA family leucine-rich repeat surface protein [Slackia sp.]